MKLSIAALLIALVAFVAPVAAQNIYVVAAGVANYKEIPSLTKCEDDAIAIAGLYKHKTKNVITYTGRYATRAALLKALSDQFSRAKKNDMIVFAFSGHGYRGGICPYDATRKRDNVISYDEVLEIMKKSKAHNKVMLIDACYSGGFRTGDAGDDHTPAQPARLKDMSVVMMLSSRTGETSKELGSMTNGLFTYFLVQGLKGNADANRDRIVTISELFDFVSQNVRKFSDDQQHPVAWGKFADDFPMMDWRKK